MFKFKNKIETFQKFSNYFPPHSNVYQKPLPSALSSWIRQRTSTLSTRQRALLFSNLNILNDRLCASLYIAIEIGVYPQYTCCYLYVILCWRQEMPARSCWESDQSQRSPPIQVDELRKEREKEIKSWGWRWCCFSGVAGCSSWV